MLPYSGGDGWIPWPNATRPPRVPRSSPRSSSTRVLLDDLSTDEAAQRSRQRPENAWTAARWKEPIAASPSRDTGHWSYVRYAAPYLKRSCECGAAGNRSALRHGKRSRAPTCTVLTESSIGRSPACRRSSSTARCAISGTSFACRVSRSRYHRVISMLRARGRAGCPNRPLEGVEVADARVPAVRAHGTPRAQLCSG